MKKSRKKAAHKREQGLHINGLTAFMLGFLGASIISYVLVNVFREEVFEFVVNALGL